MNADMKHRAVNRHRFYQRGAWIAEIEGSLWIEALNDDSIDQAVVSVDVWSQSIEGQLDDVVYIARHRILREVVKGHSETFIHERPATWFNHSLSGPKNLGFPLRFRLRIVTLKADGGSQHIEFYR